MLNKVHNKNSKTMYCKFIVNWTSRGLKFLIVQ